MSQLKDNILQSHKDQALFLVDKHDNLIGSASWVVCHFERGKLHKGFVTLLSDKDGNVHLQKRKHLIFDGLWDFTAVSHPIKNGKLDESLEEASNRAIFAEMGIGPTKVSKVGNFTYFASDGQWCENEYCYILTGNYSGDFKPNKKLVYDAKKIPFDQFIKDITQNPKNYTPWAKIAAEILARWHKKGLSLTTSRYLPS